MSAGLQEMNIMRKMVRDLVDTIPDKKLKEAFDILEGFTEDDIDEAWSIWGELGAQAGEGKWGDASEKHASYLYGTEG